MLTQGKCIITLKIFVFIIWDISKLTIPDTFSYCNVYFCNIVNLIFLNLNTVVALMLAMPDWCLNEGFLATPIAYTSST